MHNHVLIAEDDKDIVELLKLYLESNGFIVSVSYDGLEALSKLDEDVDIVIADLMMPRLNGYELIKSIREKSDIPIIIISAKKCWDLILELMHTLRNLLIHWKLLHMLKLC